MSHNWVPAATCCTVTKIYGETCISLARRSNASFATTEGAISRYYNVFDFVGLDDNRKVTDLVDKRGNARFVTIASRLGEETSCGFPTGIITSGLEYSRHRLRVKLLNAAANPTMVCSKGENVREKFLMVILLT